MARADASAGFPKTIHRDRLSFRQIPAVNNQCFPDKLVRRELVQGCPAGKQMRRGIHMGPGMGVHLQQGFLEPVFFISVGRDEFRGVRPGINRHIRRNHMREVYYLHCLIILYELRVIPAWPAALCRPVSPGCHHYTRFLYVWTARNPFMFYFRITPLKEKSCCRKAMAVK